MERPNYIDYAKSICIFLVIVGHYTYYLGIDFKPSPVWYLMHSITLFHMPFFFLISGFLYKQQSFKESIGKSWVQLMRPYFLMSAICLLIMEVKNCFSGDFSEKDIVLNIVGIASAGDFLGIRSEYSAPLWFLWALALIKMWGSAKSCGKLMGGGILLLVSMLGLAVFYMGNRLPFRIDSASVGFLFFMLGYKLKTVIKQLFKDKYTTVFTMAISLIVLIGSAYLNLDYNQRQCLSINACTFGNYPILFFASGISGTLFVLSLCKLIESTKLKPILYISNGTIIILGFHKIIYLLIFKGWIQSPTVFGALSVALCILLICYFLIIVFSKYAPILLGNRKINNNVRTNK